MGGRDSSAGIRGQPLHSDYMYTVYILKGWEGADDSGLPAEAEQRPQDLDMPTMLLADSLTQPIDCPGEG